MLQRFIDYINKQHLFPSTGEVLLAVSGGRDSVALMHLMQSAGFRFSVAHCNFHLRPGDCDRDEAFVRSLAKEYDVTYYSAEFNTHDYARQTGASVEEAARTLRYNFFHQLCRQYGFACVATAHHRDDSVETFFLNLFRGTGIAGLHGIRPKSGEVVHPMLCFSREEINRYVTFHQLQYVEDSTNAELEARRNRIRLQLMPLLRQLYPSVDAIMEANIERFSEAEEVYSHYVESIREKLVQEDMTISHAVRISLADVEGLSPRRTLLFELLRPYSFNVSVVDSLAAPSGIPTGRQFLSPTHRMVVDRGSLLISPLTQPVPPDISFERIPFSELPSLQVTSDVALLDAALLHEPLSLRRWQPADRFYPFGMKHSRLISDFLKDLKVSAVEKDNVYVLVDNDGRIVWVVGYRSDNRFRVTDQTKTVLRVTLCGEWHTPANGR